MYSQRWQWVYLRACLCHLPYPSYLLAGTVQSPLLTQPRNLPACRWQLLSSHRPLAREVVAQVQAKSGQKASRASISPTSHLKMAPMGAFCIFGIQLDMLCRWQLLSHHRQLEEYAQDCAQERPQDLHQRQRSQRCRHLYCWRHWKGAHPELRLRNPQHGFL